MTDAGLTSSISVMRSLGSAGFDVVAADAGRLGAGFASRFVVDHVVHPAPESDPAGYVDCLVDAAERLDLDVIFPVTDATILPLDRERARFDGRSVLAIAPHDAVAAAADKYRTILDADRLGIPCPMTVLVRSADEAVAASGGLGWPIVVKPRRSSTVTMTDIRRFSVTYADSVDELRRTMNTLAGRCDVLLQRWEPGQGSGVELLMDGGEVLLAFQHERLREFPVHGGPGAMRRSVPLDPDLFRASVELLSAWRWTGLAMVEFRCSGPRSTLMEVNGRVWGSIPFAIECGVDFPAHYMRLLIDGVRPATTIGDYDIGRRGRHLGKDLMWMLAVASGQAAQRRPSLPAPARREAVRAALELCSPSVSTDVMSWKDPLPSLVLTFRTLVRVGRKAIEAGFSRLRVGAMSRSEPRSVTRSHLQ